MRCVTLSMKLVTCCAGLPASQWRVPVQGSTLNLTVFPPSQRGVSCREDHVAARCCTSSRALMDGRVPLDGPIMLQHK